MPSYISSFNNNSSSDIHALIDLINTRGKGWFRLKIILPFLRYHFANYPNLLSSQHYFPKLKADEKTGKFLHSLYDSQRKSFQYIKLRRERAKQQLGCCPYCGLPGSLTLDHYLPRDVKRFPHYSALEMNLVPACYGCQIKKSNFSPNIDAKVRLVSARSKKRRLSFSEGKIKKIHQLHSVSPSTSPFVTVTQRVIHPFFDSFLKKPTIFISTTTSSSKQIKKIEIRNCSIKQKSLLEFHLKLLDMNHRIDGAIDRFKSVVIKRFENDRISIYQEAVSALPKILDEAIGRGGGVKNYIEAATIRSLASDPTELQNLIDLANKRDPNMILISVAKKNLNLSHPKPLKSLQRPKLFQKKKSR